MLRIDAPDGIVLCRRGTRDGMGPWYLHNYRELVVFWFCGPETTSFSGDALTRVAIPPKTTIGSNEHVGAGSPNMIIYKPTVYSRSVSYHCRSGSEICR